MLTLSLQVPQPPEAVMSALREDARDWRESRIPREIRRGGVLGLTSTFTAAGMLLDYHRDGYGPLDRSAPLRLRATVAADGGGSVVRVTVSRTRSPWLSLIGTVIFVVVATAFLQLPALLATALSIVLVAFNYWFVRDAERGIERSSDPEVDYLIRRVEEALVPLGAPPGNRPGPTSISITSRGETMPYGETHREPAPFRVGQEVIYQPSPRNFAADLNAPSSDRLVPGRKYRVSEIQKGSYVLVEGDTHPGGGALLDGLCRC